MVNCFALQCSYDSCQKQEFSATNTNYENNTSAAKLKYFLKYSFKTGALTFLGLFAFFISGVDFDEDIIFRKEESNYIGTTLVVTKEAKNLRRLTDENKTTDTANSTIPPKEVTYFESDVFEYPTGPSPPVFVSAA